MLSPSSIALYTKLLSPPEGYQTEQALGLSYSLDLTMLLGASVALFLGRELEGSANRERYDILSSLQDVKNRLRLFCQAGQIQVPQHYNRLYQLLEPTIYMIPMEQGSFHPKLWLIRFREKESDQVLFRLIILSKNLTDSRDWDITFHSDGILTKTRSKNKNLIEFLSKLPKQDDSVLRALIKELPFIEFEEPVNTNSWEFYGFPTSNLPFPPACSHSLIISPFLRSEQLKKIPLGEKSSYLCSRQEELDKIPAKILSSYRCYVLKDSVIDGETLIDEELVFRKKNNLHAKAYIWETEIPDRQTHVFIGSANCSNAAFTQNTEAMVYLKYEKSIWDQLINNLIDEDEENKLVLFRPYIPMVPEKEDKEKEIFKDIKRDITLSIHKVIMSKTDVSLYKMCIPIEREIQQHEGISIAVAPLSPKETFKNPDGSEIIFENLDIEDLTAFFVVKIESKTGALISFLMRLAVIGDPGIIEAREQMLMRKLFTSMNKLLAYIAYLLELDTMTAPEITVPHNASGSTNGGETLYYEILPLYEKLLMMAAENPKQLQKIDKTLSLLKNHEQIKGDDFNELMTFWEPFQHVVLGAKE